MEKVSKKKEEELDSNFISFILNYRNYNLTINELIHNVISLYFFTKNSDYESANENYQEFLTIIRICDLYASVDLCDPIHKIYNDFIKPKLKKNIDTKIIDTPTVPTVIPTSYEFIDSSDMSSFFK